ncbi:hypothetical protein ACRQ5Q_09190 [Bradyrhizobium sp. PMVTL-01]|uniref:hypothetical protein n=1 Tax=Bradyrhizobium sp. PMVTL-01 TaxID=3434999 RepID=UPI003F6E5E6C
MKVIRDPLFIGHDGGGTTYTEAELYFYLVFNKIPDDPATQEGYNEFYKKGSATSERFIFVVIDLSADKRLQTNLDKTPEGAKFYRKIVDQAPLLAIGTRPLADAENIGNVVLLPITDYKKSAAEIESRIAELAHPVKRKTLDFLKRTNDYLQLKPSFMGIGVNLNQIITDLIKRIEASA